MWRSVESLRSERLTVNFEIRDRGNAIARSARVLPGNFASLRSPFRCFIIRMKRFWILYVFGTLLVTMAHGATNFDLAANATNQLGVDLYLQLATGDKNLCISPYSIN